MHANKNVKWKNKTHIELDTEKHLKQQQNRTSTTNDSLEDIGQPIWKLGKKRGDIKIREMISAWVGTRSLEAKIWRKKIKLSKGASGLG